MMYFDMIGEMVDKISSEFKTIHPDVDWIQIKGLRNNGLVKEGIIYAPGKKNNRTHCAYH